MDAVLLSDVMQRTDMRVVQAGDGSGFALKAFSPIGSVGEMLGQDFKGYFPVQAAVFGQIDFAHTPLAQLFDDLVVREGGTDQ
jgi:hypothetical protein